MITIWNFQIKTSEIIRRAQAPYFEYPSNKPGARGSVVVKALCNKLEGRGFDSRLGEFLNLPNPSGRTRPWGLLSL
jgi:hypothetical protein